MCATGLRSYQYQGIEAIFNAWRNNTRSVLFQMPTGTGKTVVFSEIVRKGHERNRKILVVAHRKELIYHIIQKLQTHGVDAGVILAGEKPDYSKIVQVASIQSLHRREHPQADLIIIDECHHAKALSYKKLWEIYPAAKFLGVTATPIRLNGAGFEDLFDVLIPSMQIKEFIQQGYLSPIKYFVSALPDLTKIKQRQGDYVIEMLGRVMLDNTLMANLLESYQRHAFGKSAIIFAVNIEHSKQIAKRYQESGIAAVHLDSNTPSLERKQILEQFKAKQIQVLTNVEIITEGFDFPECEVVQLARPTKSLALYLQMVGRVMRKADGKAHGLILDNAGLWLEHGLPIIDREWSLAGIKKNIRTSKKAIVVNKEGIIKEPQQLTQQEFDEMELIEITEELERLLIFESYLQLANENEHKLISTFFKYQTFLKENEIILTSDELRYIKDRLNTLNATVSEERRFKLGFWFVIEKELIKTL